MQSYDIGICVRYHSGQIQEWCPLWKPVSPTLSIPYSAGPRWLAYAGLLAVRGYLLASPRACVGRVPTKWLNGVLWAFS